MKIVHFITSLATGGAEKLTVELCNEQSKNNDVVLCSIGRVENRMFLSKKLKEPVKLIALGVQKKFAISILLKLHAILRREKPQIVHIHSAMLMFYFSILLFLLKNMKFVHTIHSSLSKGYIKTFNFIKKIPLVRKNFTHVCTSKSIYEIFSGRYPELDFTVINNGIYPLQTTGDAETVRSEISRLKANEKTKVLLAISNYSPFKNLPMLVRVFKRLHEEKHNIILIVIGEDSTPDKSRYLEVKGLKGKNVYLIGAKQNIGDYLCCADALALSSVMEGMPLVVLEAFSMGVPVIATPAGGVADMVKDKKNGFTAKDFSREEMYKTLLKFLAAGAEEITAIEERNKKEFEEKYSISICKKKYDDLYNL